MKEKYGFLRRYLSQAPVFLAIERAIECRLISKLDLKRPILDLGCGDGLFSSILFSKPLELGIDISFNELKESSKKKTYKNLTAGELSLLPLKAETFNTIICNSVMEHVIDFKNAMREAHRVLSPGGKFIIAVPTENYEKFLFYPRILQGLGLEKAANCYRATVNKIFKHYHAYSTSHWIKSLEDSDFKAVKTIEFLPDRVMALSDFFLPCSSISLLTQKISRRWIIWPAFRKYIAGYLELFLKKAYQNALPSRGACVLIEAKRI